MECGREQERGVGQPRELDDGWGVVVGRRDVAGARTGSFQKARELV